MIIEQMSTSLRLSIPYLHKVARSASHRYKEYKIPKKSGGERVIHHPARELKLIQNWLLNNVLANLPIHFAATAYRRGSNIRHNAQIHVANNYLLRVDFEDFFHAFRGTDVEAILRTNRELLANVEITDEDIVFIKKLVCRFDTLTIGAPTSPQLSNAIMFDFDSTWAKRVRPNVRYTRYADDLYFSTNEQRILANILEWLREYLRETPSPNLTINDSKTVFSSRKFRRLSAGLVLTSDRKISIGRHKKRRLKALVNRLKHKQLDASLIPHLRGWISYVSSVEPDFVRSLERKYALRFTDERTWE
jgi:RNA-directed DNA polymerase